MFQIIIYKQPNFVPIAEKPYKRRRDASEVHDDELPLERSLRRSRANIRDLILCNDFDYFATFTFDPKKYDRFNYGLLKNVMLRWIRNQYHRSSPNLKFLIVPEYHKNGAIHFHALLKNFNGTKKLYKKKTKGNNKIYNITSFRAGYSTCSPLDDNKEAVAKYVSKYITKDLISKYNQQRYFCSKGLIRPKKYNNIPFLFNNKSMELYAEQQYYNIYKMKNNIDNKKTLMLN